MMTERIAKGFLAIVLRGEYQQVEPFAAQKFKNVIYVAIEEMDDNQGEVVSSFANI